MLTFQNFTMYGRLGNQMFRVASAIGIATRNKVPFSFPEWVCHRTKRNYEGFFERSLPRLDPSVRVEHKIAEGDFRYKDIELPVGVSTLSGFFQTERYFEHCRDLVRFHLEPKRSIVRKLSEKYGDNLSRSCSVHVRRTDYIQHQEHHPVLELDYYRRAVDAVRSRAPVDRFLVFSDDTKWCRENMGSDAVYVEGNQDIEDMFLMSLCSHHIIANSSFSWWGAWLNLSPDKIVVAPSVWFGPALKHKDTSEVVPNEWIRI